jgi:hypothetical protein
MNEHLSVKDRLGRTTAYEQLIPFLYKGTETVTSDLYMIQRKGWKISIPQTITIQGKIKQIK